MHLHSTDFLRLLAQSGGYIDFELAVPHGHLKGHLITIKAPDGRDLEVRASNGYRFSPVVVPRRVLDDLLREGLVIQDAAGDEGRLIFRLTVDGTKRGKSAVEGPQWLIARMQNWDRPPSPVVRRIAEEYMRSMAPTTGKPPQE